MASLSARTYVQEAYKNASEGEKKIIENTVGNKDASSEDIEKVKAIFASCGGIEYAESLAQSYIESAMTELEVIKDSEYKEILKTAADFMSARKL